MWTCPTKNLPGCMARLHLVRLRMLDGELHLGLSGMLLECQEREQLPRVIAEQKILLHHRSSNCNCHVQRSKSFLDHKSSRSKSHGDVDEEELPGTCPCAPAIQLCSSITFAVHRNSFQTAPNRNKGCT